MSGVERDGGGEPMPGTAAPDEVEGRSPLHTMDAVEHTVSRVLIVGMALSVALMAAGLALGIVDGEPIPQGVVGFARLPHALVTFDPGAYLSLGLIVLILTPFVRVGGSIVAFAREHDRRYVLITSVVFAVMCLSVLVGRA